MVGSSVISIQFEYLLVDEHLEGEWKEWFECVSTAKPGSGPIPTDEDDDRVKFEPYGSRELWTDMDRPPTFWRIFCWRNKEIFINMFSFKIYLLSLILQSVNRLCIAFFHVLPYFPVYKRSLLPIFCFKVSGSLIHGSKTFLLLVPFVYTFFKIFA